VSHFVVWNGGGTDIITVLVASEVPEPTSPLLIGCGAPGLAEVPARRGSSAIPTFRGNLPTL